MNVIRLASACAFLAAAPAWSDAPLAVPTFQVCSTNGKACATRDRNGRSATVWRTRSGGKHVGAWRARITSPRLLVSDDGRSLVELYPGLNLLELSAGPGTVVLVFHRPGVTPLSLQLRDVIARPSQLPRTVSHRRWADTYDFDGSGDFVLETAEGRTLRIDPSTGRFQPGRQRRGR